MAVESETLNKLFAMNSLFFVALFTKHPVGNVFHSPSPSVFCNL